MASLTDIMNVVSFADAKCAFNTSIFDVVPLPRTSYHIECVGPDGQVKWTEDVRNLVTTVGRTFNLEVLLRAGVGGGVVPTAYTAAWYLVLKGAGTIAAGDTLASHAGWTEVTPYASASRPTVTFPAVAAGAVTSNTVAITVNATATVAGAGICTTQAVGTNTGTLYAMTDFAASRSVASGDTLNVTVNFSVT
jgi:hypothetical protein